MTGDADVDLLSFRRELIATVRDLIGPLEPSRTPVGSSFRESWMFLFEEAEIDRDLSPAIGRYLRNQDEADALKTLVAPIEAVFAEVGDEADDATYQAASSWPKVQAAATKALPAFSANS